MCQGASGKRRASQPSERPEVLIPRTLNECQHTQTAHIRTIKELVKCRSEHPETFFASFCDSLRPVYLVQEKEPSVERVVRYVSAFAAYRDEEHAEECNSFVEEFLKHLLVLVDAANKTVRSRACQLIAEVMTRLADDVELSDEMWEELIGSMQTRMQDKVPAVRVNAARALVRLISGDDNDSTVTVYREALESDRSADVRKMVVLSIPIINSTIPQVFEHTMDVSDSVRRATYSVLGIKIPINTLSIMQRAKVLQRGLADRVPAVQAECVNMLKSWLNRDCDGDIFALLRYLDVETNEKVGELVLNELLKHGIFKANEGEGLRQFLLPLTAENAENEEYEAQLMGAEQALYWRIVCTTLHAEAQAKGNEAATTGGAQSVLNAAAAADANEVLDSILPPTVASYVELVTLHLNAGPKHRFASRQLVLLAKVLDFTDSTNRKVAGTLVKTLLLAEVPESQQDVALDIDPEAFVGDGLSLGGDQDWAAAVAELAVKVYSEQGEYEKILADAISRLGQPCRDGGAEASQWLHCLAVTSLLLERIMSLRQLVGCAIGGQEILDALLLPAAKHVHPEVQKSGIRCLGLFAQLATKPTSSVVRQLRLSISSGIPIVQNMAIKALFDFILCHGATNLDRAIDIGPDLGPVPEPCPFGTQVPAYGVEGDLATAMRKPLLELLVSLLDSGTIYEEMDEDIAEDPETPRSLVAEGFAKLLLQSRLFKDIQAIEDAILAKLLRLYFNDDLEISPRLQQCLSVFFNNYSVLSAENKKCVAKAFIPVMRAEWPGIYGNKGVAAAMISAKKRATQLSRFMLQLLQNPLLASQQVEGDSDSRSPDLGHESLAINIALEVKRSRKNTSASAKAYILQIARIATALEFRSTAQEEIKCMLQLLGPMMDAVAGDKVLLKELKEVHEYLKSMDNSPEEFLSDEQLQILLEKYGLKLLVEEDDDKEPDGTPAAKPKKTPKKQSTTKSTKKAAAAVESPAVVGITRSQRKSKSEALHRLSLSAAKQRTVDSDDSMEESFDHTAGNPSESDEDNDSGTEITASKPSTSSDTLQPMDTAGTSTTAAEQPILPTAVETPKASSDTSSIEPDDDDDVKANLEPVSSRPSTRAVRVVETASKKTTQKKTAGKSKSEVSMPARPRTRRQASMTASEISTVSNATEDEADSATTKATSSQTLAAIESGDSDSDFERLPVKIQKKIEKKVEKKVAPPAAQRPTTRARSAWK
ncbi:hypothetical protein M758_8G178700 [Ceratodon purpureus]|nr:hypothetical protein M758_8G178700 [Ceratodon purpureus]